MYDADTVALIANAPPLAGLNLRELPKQLTEAYAKIVAARLRVIEALGGMPDEITEIVFKMRRLAAANEAFVVATDRDNRAAAAFVAGSAHHLVALAESSVGTVDARPSSLTAHGISPEVAAALLFLVAESSADAAEMARSITIATDDPVEAALLQSIAYLAIGHVPAILNLPFPPADAIRAADGAKAAVRALYHTLLKGIRSMAEVIAGEPALVPRDGDAIRLFEQVRTLSVDRNQEVIGADGPSVLSVVPGPLHLASLLIAVARDLPSSALARLRGPNGIDGPRWAATVRGLAARRPYLWRNHRQAIEAGYLQPGTSSVISFPTGAGKSTLAELKIAAALLRGLKVVFLAPTLALVDQTAKALQTSFPAAELERERAEEFSFDFDLEQLPEISVMTPERCLALLSFDRTVFEGVGLFIFDECHLLHPRMGEAGHRGLDAMLCVLNFTDVARDADILFLSAMMQNAGEISEWLGSLTGRPCLPLALNWKPTRQVRGCVVYASNEIGALNDRLRAVRARVPNKNAPAALRRQLTVRPYGFFCLHQTWQSRARQDYTLLPLLDSDVTLETGAAVGRWYLTPNGNKVAAALGAATAQQGLKTLIFAQTIPLATSAAADLAQRLFWQPMAFTEEEQRLFDLTVDEMGGDEFLYVEVDHAGDLTSPCLCHHGLLLPFERHLHESLFKRQDGITALVATSTLAQGMNLPSEVVIIAGDSRFDATASKVERLQAHELLNAAGRAGRAGDGSYGFVLIVPSKVVDFDAQRSQIAGHWTDLQAIFSQSDQCLVIDDPLIELLDQIHNAAANPVSENANYLLRRLPSGDPGALDPDDAARNLMQRSFAAFRARQRNDQDWLNTRIEAALALRRAAPDAAQQPTWADTLAAAAGIPVQIVREMSEGLRVVLADPNCYSGTIGEVRQWLMAWLALRPAHVLTLVRRETLDGFFGKNYKELQLAEDKGRYALPLLDRMLQRWMAGDSLAELEAVFGTPRHRVGKCDKAREFVVRIIPELAYVFGLPGMIIREILKERGEEAEGPVACTVLGQCVKAGFDRPEKLVLRQIRRGRLYRRAVHREYDLVSGYIAAPQAVETLLSMRNRVEQAAELFDMLGRGNR